MDSKYITVEQRYLHDQYFRNLVDMLTSMFSTMSTTPTEVREACMLAHYRVESRKYRPVAFESEHIKAWYDGLES
jgi:hypothetical protein